MSGKFRKIVTMIEFIWHHKRNRTIFWIAIGMSMGLWVIFKLIYVYPNIVFDSYSYIRAAVLHLNVNAWPIGYSKFLRMFGYLSHSANLLMTAQYVFLMTAFLAFYFTWLMMFQPGRLIRRLMFLVLFVNPLWCFVSNLILADALFTGLSVFWITQLLWILFRPSRAGLLVHGLLLFLVFTVRYNALYYPLISLVAILFSRMKMGWKVVGIVMPLVLIGVFVLFTSRESKRMTGVAQLSAFGGWKLANDALIAYGHVDAADLQAVPAEYAGIDSLVRVFYQIPGWQKIVDEDPSSGSFFMLNIESPLVQYIGAAWPYFGTTRWFAAAPLYQSYGLWLIRQYPGAFFRRFIAPNLVQYFIPPREVLGSPVPYMLHESFGGPYLRELFGITTIETDKRYIGWSGKVMYWYPVLFTLIHLIFLLGLALFLYCKGFKGMHPWRRACLLMVCLLWLCDFGFSIVSAGIVLRYQLFMTILELSFGVWMLEYSWAAVEDPAKRNPLRIIPDRS